MRIVQDNECKVYCRECDTTSVVKLKHLKKGYIEDLDINCRVEWYKTKCTCCKKTIYINPESLAENKKVILENIEKQKIRNIKCIIHIITLGLWIYVIYTYLFLVRY